jgi:hypothetical protein
MKELLEEYVLEKQALLQQQQLLLRVISYVDRDHDDDSPIHIKELENVDVPNIRVEGTDVYIDYPK